MKREEEVVVEITVWFSRNRGKGGVLNLQEFFFSSNAGDDSIKDLGRTC